MTTATNSAGAGENEAHGRLLRQRDQALVCAVVAAAMAATIFWNNFGRESPELSELLQAVQQHRVLLSEHQKIMETVHAALLATQREQERLSPAH